MYFFKWHHKYIIHLLYFFAKLFFYTIKKLSINTDIISTSNFTYHLLISILYFLIRVLQPPCHLLTWRKVEAGHPKLSIILYLPVKHIVFKRHWFHLALQKYYVGRLSNFTFLSLSTIDSSPKDSTRNNIISKNFIFLTGL